MRRRRNTPGRRSAPCRRGDRATDVRERRAVVELHAAAGDAHTKAPPHVVEIHMLRVSRHPGVKVTQDVQTRGAVANVERLRQWPANCHRAAGVHDRAQRIVERASVLRLLPDPDVSDEAEQRAAPVRTSPCRRSVEPAIAWLRLSVRKPGHEIRPNLGCGKLTDARARDWLHVCRNALFDPQVVARHVREGEMHHLVGQHPVARDV